MQDTAKPQNFVLYGCDAWSIIAEMTCDTPNALVVELQKHNSMMALPDSVDWSGIAALAFHGFPARILNGDGRETFLLIQAPILPFYVFDDDPKNLVRDTPSYWTLQDYEVAVAS